ncbi:hypothetical protein Y032_0003g1558 [Ancylostoma ceylanicum]|uniref:Uncharacterized protein n=1 Tax=Ancylostoma ceylanicum TaxID=53326 RepID=A0A016VYC3_9BILA|nr:hypothetical protein Y032_0003g1558 [Ancylostoma ceylanicum]
MQSRRNIAREAAKSFSKHIDPLVASRLNFICPWQDLSKDLVNFISSNYGGEVSWSLKAFCHTCRQVQAFVTCGMDSTELQTMPQARLRPFLNEGHRQGKIL